MTICPPVSAAPALSEPYAVLFVADRLDCGGAERHLVALACGLARLGHRVAVACVKDDSERGGPAALAAALRAGGVAVLPSCHAHRGLDFAALDRLRLLFAQAAPDVIVATSQYGLLYALLARRRALLCPPVAFICHSMGMVRRDAAARLRFLVYRHCYRHPDCVVFVSHAQRRYFASLGITPRRTEVVHNGIDLSRFAPGQGEAEAAILRARYGLDRAHLVIGLCAVFRPEKRHVDLLSALARLRAAGVAATVVLIGDGPLRSRILAWRDALGLGDGVLLAGLQQDVRPYLAMCDVVALTSHDENFPLATLEAMALARPVVASAVGALSEQIAHGVNGLLYPPCDIAALAAALQRCADPQLRERLGQAARCSVRQRFGQAGMLARYDAILRSLVTIHPVHPKSAP